MGTRGVSLIEILIASVILALGLAAVFLTLGTGHRDTGRIEDEIQATNLGQNALDFLAGLPFGQLPGKTRDGRELSDLPISSLADEMAGRADAETVSLVRQKVAALPIPTDFEMLVSYRVLSRSREQDREPASRFGDVARVIVRVRWVALLAPGKQVSRQIVLTTLVTDDRAVDL